MAKLIVVRLDLAQTEMQTEIAFETNAAKSLTTGQSERLATGAFAN